MTPSPKPSLSASTGMPWFTERDTVLTMAGAVRDPMGRQAVWRGGIGRQLVPHLASSVTDLNGVIGVLFAYHMLDVAAEAGYDWKFMHAFRLLEGCIEFYLKSVGDAPIHGARALGDRFEVKHNDGRTVCNGLRQYYRGTCQRAGLVSRDLSSLTDDASELCRAVLAGREPEVKVVAAALNQALSERTAVDPGEEIVGPNTQGAWSRFFDHTHWKTSLRSRLLGSAPYQLRFAELCSDVRLGAATLKSAIAGMMKQTSDTKSSELLIRRVLPHMMRCEVFICWSLRIFEWLQRHDRKPLPILAGHLEAVWDRLADAAREFLKIPSVMRTDRFEELAGVAEAVGRGRQEAIVALVEYHRKVMASRGYDALVQVDSNALAVMQPEEGSLDLESCAKAIEEGKWLDDYYTTAAGRIYRQTEDGEK